MPFKSQSQREWMYENFPEMAKKWEEHTPSSPLPEKKMSDSFAGSNTASIEQHNQRALRRLDVFTDDFQPPGTADSGHGTDLHDRPYGDKHTDTSSKDSTSKLSFPGPDGDEDRIDREENSVQSALKPTRDMFPGSDVAEFDARQTDPTMMKKELQKDLGISMNWFEKVSERTGIKYAGKNQFQVIVQGEPHGIFNDAYKAKEVLKKYLRQ